MQHVLRGILRLDTEGIYARPVAGKSTSQVQGSERRLLVPAMVAHRHESGLGVRSAPTLDGEGPSLLAK